MEGVLKDFWICWAVVTWTGINLFPFLVVHFVDIFFFFPVFALSWVYAAVLHSFIFKTIPKSASKLHLMLFPLTFHIGWKNWAKPQEWAVWVELWGFLGEGLVPTFDDPRAPLQA